MHVRSGYLIGKPKDGAKERFDSGLRDLVPRMAALPGLERVRLLWSRLLEPQAPRIYATIELDYTSQDAMEAALKTELRQQLRGRFVELMADFDGVLTHVNSDA